MFTVTQNWKPLDKSKYTWDEESKTFSTTEKQLVLDFSEYNWVTFTTGSDCTFNTGTSCTFYTGSYCTFDTGSSCTFNTGTSCTFNTLYKCTFNTGSDCVVVRRDVYEVIELTEWVKIKLNRYWVKWYTEITDTKTITLDGKDIEVSVELYEKFLSDCWIEC